MRLAEVNELRSGRRWRRRRLIARPAGRPGGACAKVFNGFLGGEPSAYRPGGAVTWPRDLLASGHGRRAPL